MIPTPTISIQHGIQSPQQRIRQEKEKSSKQKRKAKIFSFVKNSNDSTQKLH
jgi:hypothetical protein